MPSSSISSANNHVEPLLKEMTESQACHRKRSRYDSFTDEEKAKIARSTYEIGVTNTIRKLSKQYSDKSLKESTVRTWMNKYKNELETRKKAGIVDSISRLPSKRRGRPLILTREFDQQVQNYVYALRDKGSVVNSAIIMAC
jgi:transposase-like protein